MVGAVSLGSSAIFVRSVGPAAWAAYSIGYFLTSFMEQALNPALLGRLIQMKTPPGARELEASTALIQGTALLLAGALLAVSGSAGNVYHDDRLTTCLIGVAVALIVIAWRATPLAVLERALEYRLVAVTEVVDNCVFVLVALPFVVAGHGFTGLVVALALRNVPGAVLLRVRARTPLTGRPRRSEVAALLRFGVPAAGAVTFSFLLNGLVPAVTLGGRHATELAWFMTTSTIVGYAATSYVVVQRIGFPSLSSLQADAARFGSAVERIGLATNVLLLAALIPTCATAPVWLPLLFGSDWRPAGLVMALLGGGSVALGLTGVVTTALNALDHPRSVLFVHGTATVGYLGLALLLTASNMWRLGPPVAYLATRTGGLVIGVLLLRRAGLRIAWRADATAFIVGCAGMVGSAAAFEKGSYVLGTLALAGSALAVAVLRRSGVRLVIKALRLPSERRP